MAPSVTPATQNNSSPLIKGPDNPTSQLLPIIRTHSCSASRCSGRRGRTGAGAALGAASALLVLALLLLAALLVLVRLFVPVLARFLVLLAALLFGAASGLLVLLGRLLVLLGVLLVFLGRGKEDLPEPLPDAEPLREAALLEEAYRKNGLRLGTTFRAAATMRLATCSCNRVKQEGRSTNALLPSRPNWFCHSRL